MDPQNGWCRRDIRAYIPLLIPREEERAGLYRAGASNALEVCDIVLTYHGLPVKSWVVDSAGGHVLRWELLRCGFSFYLTSLWEARAACESFQRCHLEKALLIVRIRGIVSGSFLL